MQLPSAAAFDSQRPGRHGRPGDAGDTDFAAASVSDLGGFNPRMVSLVTELKPSLRSPEPCMPRRKPLEAPD